MTTNISLDKQRINLKGKGKRTVVPLGPSGGKQWDEPDDEDVYVCRIYKIMSNNEGIIEPNNNGEIYLGSPMPVSQKSDLELYN